MAKKRGQKGYSGNGKGQDFERFVSKKLSLWLSRGMRDDLFWRTAMSGGRATLQFMRGKTARAQAGDISAIDAIGERLTSRVLIETKNYRNLLIHSLLAKPKLMDRPMRDSIAQFWHECYHDAITFQRLPMLIFKQSNLGEFVMLNQEGTSLFCTATPCIPAMIVLPLASIGGAGSIYIYHLDDFLKYARRPNATS